MNLIKLNATESTNSYLKELRRKMVLDNFTVVFAFEQSKGRGQMNATWESEKGKNLIFSILIEWEGLKVADSFYISKIVSISIFQCLRPILEAEMTIKWPNDIMAEGQKIAGVLIENSVKKAKVSQSVIGIGLNVNQELFRNLPQATSMKMISKKEFDLDLLLEKLINSLKKYSELLNNNEFEIIDALYLKQLFKLNQPAMYKNMSQKIFMGKIVGVSSVGLLQIELEDETIREFDLKEVQYYS